MATDMEEVFFMGPFTSLPPETLQTLPVETRIELMARELRQVNTGLSHAQNVMVKAALFIGTTLLGLVGVGVVALLLVGAYRERVDTMNRTVERLDSRIGDLQREVSGLSSAVERQPNHGSHDPSRNP